MNTILVHKQYYNNTVDIYAFLVITLQKYLKCFSFYFSFSSSLINLSCAFVIFIVFAFLMSI